MLRGPSGVGKSDLALRLLAAGGTLIADDQTLVRVEAGQLLARAPEAIRGMMEVRGVGLVAIPACAEAPLTALVDCVSPDAMIERLPESRIEAMEGIPLHYMQLHALEASAVAKIRIFLAQLPVVRDQLPEVGDKR